MLRNQQTWAFWCWCLLRASYKEKKVQVGLQQVVLQPGQFIFGRKKASKDLHLSEQQVRGCLEFMKDNKKVTIKSTNKFSIITIINWDIYQSDKITEQPTNQPASNQQATTNKNSKEYKEKRYKYAREVIFKENQGSQKPSEPLSDKEREYDKNPMVKCVECGAVYRGFNRKICVRDDCDGTEFEKCYEVPTDKKWQSPGFWGD